MKLYDQNKVDDPLSSGLGKKVDSPLGAGSFGSSGKASNSEN